MMSRDAVVKQVASLIDGERHKVNLGSPDKVILVEIFQVRFYAECLLRSILFYSASLAFFPLLYIVLTEHYLTLL